MRGSLAFMSLGSIFVEVLQYESCEHNAPVHKFYSDVSNADLLDSQSILTIDKSEEPFHIQLEKTSQILGIDLETQWIDQSTRKENIKKQRALRSDPRPKHALRWLLKKLQSSGEGLHNYRSYHKAWILLRILLACSPLGTAAELVKRHELMLSLRTTSQWLQDNCCASSGYPSPATDEKRELPTASPDTSETSSTHSCVSRKRKRGCDQSVNLQSRVSPLSETKSITFERTRSLFIALCGVLAQLEELVNDPENEEGLKAEHLRFAIKSSAEHTAIVLGNLLYITNHLIRNPCKSSSESRSQVHLADTAYRFCIIPIVEFWCARSHGPRKSSEDSRDVCMTQVKVRRQADWNIQSKLSGSIA